MKSSTPGNKSGAGDVPLPPIHCRNCGREVHHNFCAHCGQHRADHNKGLGHFLKEFWGEFVQVDSKFLRTLYPLCLKPGFLTQEWVAGKRVRYITPLKMYLTISAICFLIVTYQYDQAMKAKDPKKRPDIIQINDSDDVSTIAKEAKKLKTAKTSSTKGDFNFDSFMDDNVGFLTQPGTDGEAKRKDFSEKFVGRLSTANFLLLPVFALLFKLLYIRRSRFYVEHLVFALHYYSFFFLALSICMLCQTPYVVVPVGIWMAVYMPIAMVRHYQQGLIKTLFKGAIFGFLYLLATSFALLGLVIVTAIDTRSLGGSSKAVGAKKTSSAPKQPVASPTAGGAKPSLPSSGSPSSAPSTAQ